MNRADEEDREPVVAEAVEKVIDLLAGLPGVRRITSRSPTPRDKPEDSPYYGLAVEDWAGCTRDLIDAYPIPPGEIVELVLRSWDAIFDSTLGKGFHIGTHIFPTPQIMGTLLHELIPLEIEAVRPGEWRVQATAGEKDLVCARDDHYSTEIKTSSDPSRIFANRSYGQASDSPGKKAKSGYYIAVNFEGFPVVPVKPAPKQLRPQIRLIRLGWLDHTDWIAQRSETGQQSSLPAAVENNQLLVFHKK